MHLRPYPEYKDSGVPWLGQVPKEWGLLPNKQALKVRYEIVGNNFKDYVLLSLTLNGVIKRDMVNPKGKFPAEFNTYQIVQPGDFVFCLFDVDETPRTVGLSPYKGMITGAYTVLQPISNNPRYLYYLYLSFDNGKVLKPIYTGLRKVIPIDSFLRIKNPLPSAPEQNQIARYLDWKTVQIAKFIKDKKRMIELLKEQKQVIINDAVTGKIDVTTGKPYPKYKDSGVEWLGYVPKDWDMSRIKQNAKILRGKFSHRPRNDARFYNGNYPFIQTGDIARAGKYVTRFKQTLNENGLSVSKIFPKGTLLMTIAANIGDVAILDFDACFPDSIVGFVPHLNLHLDFLYYLFTTMKQELLKDAPVNTQGNLNIERIGVMRISLPSMKEQISIIESIQSKTAILELAISRTEREIGLMQEYRDRLIADVVTGKLDVRGIAVPEELEELSVDDADSTDEEPDEIENEEEA